MPTPSKVCVKRLQKELRNILKNPVPNLQACPRNENILEWHYVIYGLKDSYVDGVYHGILKFPCDYPYKPPSLQMVTPSGRFHTNTKLCLSFTDFHPESWNPMWSVSTILSGLVSFFSEESHTYGSMSATRTQRLYLAKQSSSFNLRDTLFCKLFPEMADICRQNVRKQRKDTEGEESGSSKRKSQSSVDEGGSKGISNVPGQRAVGIKSQGKFIESIFLILFLSCFFGVVSILVHLSQKR